VSVWKVILATVVIFSTGVITGGLIARKTYAPAPPPEVHSTTNRPSQGFRPDRRMRRDFIERVSEELDLSPEQRQEVEAVLSESQQRTRKLWEEISPQMRAEFEATQDKIRALLTPEQQQQFETMLQRRHAPRGEDRDRRDRGPEGPPGPPPPDGPPPEAD